MKKLTLFSLFAVFVSLSMQMAAADYFTRVTEEPETWDGEYIIYDPISKCVWNGSKEGGSLLSMGNSHKADGMIIDGKINWNITDTYFTITSLPEGGYSIRSYTNYFIGAESLLGRQSSITTPYANDISFSNGTVNITSRNTSEKYNFACYKDGFFTLLTEEELAEYEKYYVSKDLVLFKRDNPSNKVSTPYFNYETRSYVLKGNILTIDSDPGTHLVTEMLAGSKIQHETNHVEITLPEDDDWIYIDVYAVDPTGKKQDSDKVNLQLHLVDSSVDNIKQIYDEHDTQNQKRFNNPVTVVFQNKEGGLYIKDNTGSILVLNSKLTGLKNGDIINGGFNFSLTNNAYGYWYLNRIQNMEKSETPGTPVSPTEIKIANVEKCKVYDYVTVYNVKYKDGFFYDRKDGSKIEIFSESEINNTEFENDKVYNITGFIEKHISFNRWNFNVISKEELQLVETPSVTPAFGQINKGCEITITSLTEGAVLNGTVNGETIENATLPYSFKALNDGDLSISVCATKEGFVESDVLEGTYTVVTPQVEPLCISPELGKILIGTEITISCHTENAVLNGAINGKTIENAILPYSFIAESTGELSLNVHASKEYCTDSETLEGTFNVCYPQIEPLSISPNFGLIEKGTEITISYPEGTTLNGTVNGVAIENAPNPYKFKAENTGEIIVNVWASKEEMEDSEVLNGTFTVESYAYKDIISYTDKEFINKTNTNFFNITRSGAAYRLDGNIVEDENKVNHHLMFDRKAGNKRGIVMKSSPASVSSVIITWDETSTNGAGFIIYGKNTPYTYSGNLYDTNEAESGTLITTVYYSESLNNVTTIELGDQFSFIGIRPVDKETSNIKSFEYRWNESTQGGQDVIYKKVTSTSKLKNGRFVVLATEYGDAVKREEASGHINSAEVTYDNGSISLTKGQQDVEEFEIVIKDKYTYLRGGLEADDTRRYLAGVQYSGLKTIKEPEETARVTFEKKSDGYMVKFSDGEYLTFYDNKFVKGSYVETAAQSGENIVLLPVYIYASDSNVSTGVEDVTINAEDCETTYYNLNGIQVNAENLTPGLYIVRQGNKVTKQLIR